MSNEHTPLIRTVRVTRPRRHAKRNVVARFCTIALSSTLVWLFLAFVVSILVFPSDHARHHDDDDDWSWPGSRRRNVTYDQLRKILLDTPSTLKLEDWSKYYTSGPHLTGKNFSQVCSPYLPLKITTDSGRPCGPRKRGKSLASSRKSCRIPYTSTTRLTTAWLS